MRQAGVIAAAGVIALQKMIDRLVEDHEKAQELALGLSQIEGIRVEKNPPPSNMIFLSMTDSLGLNASQLAQILRENGILVGVVDLNRIRLVMHYWIHNDDISHVIGAVKNAISGQH
jgi:threonine aldolase